MDVNNSFIKPTLLFYFGKGMSEIETYSEVSKQHNQNAITLKTIYKWYEVFRAGSKSLDYKKKNHPKLKFSDEYLINLINENPGLNMKELGILSNTSASTISNRLKRINIWGEKVKYCKYKFQNDSSNYFEKKPKLNDEYLINLINNNPDLSKIGLAKLANVSESTISNRIKQMNRDSERVNYTSKEFKFGAPKFTDEFLVNLINENPGVSLKELAELTDTTVKTVSRRLSQINSNRANDDKICLKKKKAKSKAFNDEYLINLINENPDLNMVELGKLSGTTAKTISIRLKQINSNGQRVNYIKKDFKKLKKFTDKFLINLVNDNLDLNLTELSKLSNIPVSTLSIRLKKIKGDGENCIKKEFKSGALKFTDEFLINLINENPELNMKELGKLANTNAETISRRLKTINSNGERINYIKKNNHKGEVKLSDEF